MTVNSKTIFLDTNIYLHYKFFPEIPWETLLEAQDVILAVPPIIHNELEKQKYLASSSRIRERAESVVRRFAQLIDSPRALRPGVQIEFIGVEPTDFDSYNLVRESQDDQLLASILDYRRSYPDKNITLITNDSGLRVKSKQRGVATFSVPDVYRRRDDTTEEKKIKELEKRVRQLEATIPQLQLQFADGSDRLTVHPASIISEAHHVEQEMRGIKRMYPERRPRVREHYDPNDFGKLTNTFIVSLNRMDDPDPDDLVRYNDELPAFYESYESYLRKNYKVDELLSRTVKLEIAINNAGTAPAEDIGVFLNFDAGFKITVDENLFKPPKKPQPPKGPRPLSTIDSFRRHFDEDPFPRVRITAPTFPPIAPIANVTWSGLTRENDVQVAHFEIRKLNHGYSKNCPRLIYVIFDSFTDVRSFRIDYEITAANIPHKIHGSLHVVSVFEREDRSDSRDAGN